MTLEAAQATAALELVVINHSRTNSLLPLECHCLALPPPTYINATTATAAFLPTMTAKRCLGFTDEEGNPKDPVYAIGEVITAGKNLPSKHNHSQYIEKSGHYDIGWYLLDHKVHFPAILYHVGVGQLCPHISTEVDCEYLFCQSWLPC